MHPIWIVLLGAVRPNTVDGTIAGAKTDAAAALRKLRLVMILLFFCRDMIPPVNPNNDFLYAGQAELPSSLFISIHR